MKFFLLLIALFLVHSANASVIIGTGFNSSTGGRSVPTLNLGIGVGTSEYSLTSVGVATTSYYHSAHNLNWFRAWKAGDIGGGEIAAGFGAGVLYAVRGFKDTGSESVTKSDYVVGPAFFGRWNFFSGLFVSVESLYGLVGPSSRSLDLVGLNAKDHVNFSFGVRL